MNKDKNNEKADADILRCRADILRARDIMPPYDKTTSESQDSQRTDESANLSAASKPSVAATVDYEPDVTNQHNEHEIPKFNLAEEIMAEQRRITAIRRKAPSKKIEVVKPQSTISSSGLSQLQRPLIQEQIIAEIVARDIEKLCRGDVLDVHRQDSEDIIRGA